MADLPSNVTAALSNAPELAATPGLALGLAQAQGDPGQNAQVGSYAATQAGLADAQTEHANNGNHGLLHSIHNFFGGAIHDVATPVEGALHALNYGLAQMQHQYRYVHDVYDRHGFIPGLLATAQTYLAPELDFTRGHIAHYSDSWDMTTDGAHYTDSAGNVVSPGRDLGNLVNYLSQGHLQNNPNGFDGFDVVSGLGDAVFDLGADPTIAAGKVKTGMSLGRRLVQIDRNTGADNMVHLYDTNNGVKRAVDQLAASDTKDIITNYPALRPLAPELGRADSAAKVIDVFRSALTTNAYASTRYGMPYTSITRRSLGQPLTAKVMNLGTKDMGDGVEGYNFLGRKLNALSSYHPLALDSKSLTISDKKFDPSQASSIQTVYQLLRFSQSQRTAAAVAGKYADASIADRVGIYRNGVIDTLRAAGLPDDSPVIRKLQADFDSYAHAGTIHSEFGLGRDGQSVGPFEHLGKTINGAVFVNQTGDLAIPNFNAIRRGMRDAKGGPLGPFWHALGKMDDWAYNTYTSGFFKPLALLNLGFALRVAANENVLALGEYGPRNIIGAKASASAAKIEAAHPNADLISAYNELGLPTDGILPEEGHHFRAAVSKALYKLAPDADMVRIARLLVARHDGHLLSPAITAGDHGGVTQLMAPRDKMAFDIYRAHQHVPKDKRLGEQFTTYTSDNANHPMFWHMALGEPAGDPGVRLQAQAYLDHLPAGEDAAFREAQRVGADWIKSDEAAVHREMIARFTAQTPEEAAAVRTEAMLGLVYGQDGTLHRDLLENIAAGNKTDLAKLEAIPADQRPRLIKGRTLDDAPQLATLHRVINYGFKKMIDPTINNLSREPQYVAAVTAEFKSLEGFIARGELDVPTALNLAEQRGIQNMLPQIHNTMLRSQMHDTFRNYMPFYFAQEQAYKRYGRLFLRRPETFRKVQLAMHGLHSTSFTRKDDQGNDYILMPGDSHLTGLLTKGLSVLHPVGGAYVGVPSSLSGNMDSLRTVFPEGNLPGVSPVVSIPSKWVEQMFPESRELIQPVIGDIAQNQSAWDAVMPSATFKRLVQASPLGPGDKSRAFQSAYLYAIQSAARRGEFDNETQDPQQIQATLDRIKNTTRIMFLVKAMYGVVSPLNPKMDVGDVHLRDEVRQSIKDAGGNPGLGLQNFLDKNPDATPFTVFQSESPSGASLPATEVAGQWALAHKGFVKSNQYAAAYLMPQTGKGQFNAEAYDAQLAMGMRVKRAPGDFVRELYLVGDKKTYFDSLKAYQTERDALPDADKFDKRQLAMQWANFQQDFFAQHPYFQGWLEKPHVESEQAYQQISKTLDGGTAPEGEQTDLVRGLRDSYRAYASEMAMLKAQAANRRTQGLTNQMSDLRDSWKGFLDAKAAEDPRLASVINGVFKHLPDPAGDATGGVN